MRILQIHDETWDSGIAHYALTLSAELKKRGHEVHFWAAWKSYAALRAREAGLPGEDLHLPWLSLPALRSRLKERRIELINAHTGSAHSLAYGLTVASNLPIVRTRAEARPPTRHPLAKALAARTRFYIAANTRIQNEIYLSFPATRVALIFQGLPVPEKPAKLPESQTVGILGRLDPVKGHEDFLETAGILKERFPRARFLVAGGGKPERLAALKMKALALGLEGKVEFLGHVPKPMAFIASCRIGVLASVDSEAVSRAALEWMSLGRPLVATRVGCLPDLISEGKTGFLISPRDPIALAGALQRLLENPWFAESQGLGGRERFQNLFSLSRFAADTEELYENALRNISH
jgi:glycosyltransferase involved in cell wall biosynthesis